MAERVGVGVVGCGAIAQRYHIPALQSSPYTEVAVVVDVDSVRARETAERFGIPAWSTDYTNVFSDDKIAAVSVCTPNKFHAVTSVGAARAGKHVLCEKPMAMDMEEANRMVEAARQAGTFLMVEFPMRFDPGYAAARQAVETGMLGEIVSVRSNWAHGGPQLWSPSGKWFFAKDAAGGGALLDLGIHNIDFICSLFGDVAAVLGSMRTLRSDSSVEDIASLLLEFENGISGMVTSSWMCLPDVVETEIHGTKGRLLVSGWPTERVTLSLSGQVKGDMELKFPENKGTQDGHFRCIQYFAECIAKNTPPKVATGDDGRRAIAIAQAGYRSALEGKRVPVRL
ncbi:Gfo/Idh/MocA family oxidoreductase [Moorella naiadis]|uniref:Gfo/Idh/MocA family protein n=1 Tax=Moorella naiadis (nom. illeg.) TaxID=3093670 RepID=UPI003D9CBD72